MTDRIEAARHEVEALHAFFTAWFNGTADDPIDRFASVLDPSFTIIGPGGDEHDRDAIVERVEKARGVARAEPMTITIRGFRPLWSEGDLVLTRYEEWQGPDERGRLSTALLRIPSGSTPPVEWIHVHETWIPIPE